MCPASKLYTGQLGTQMIRTVSTLVHWFQSTLPNLFIGFNLNTCSLVSIYYSQLVCPFEPSCNPTTLYPTRESNNYCSIKPLRFFNHIKYSLKSLFLIYSCKNLVMVDLIPRVSRYFCKAFCKLSSKSLVKKTKINHETMNK